MQSGVDFRRVSEQLEFSLPIMASWRLGIAWANPLKRFEISAIVSWMRKVRVLFERDGVVEVSQTAGHFKL